MSYAEHADEYERLLAEIAAGTQLHYAPAEGSDQDLDLLNGDHRYAEGLARLAALGDLETTRILGDAISQIARAHAEGDPGTAETVWEQALHAVRTIR